jgi:hypothetical protein
MMEGKKTGSYKKDFEVAIFTPLKILTSHFYLKRLLELFFFFPSLSLSLFFPIFFFLFSMLHIFEDSGILMTFEEKDNLRKFWGLLVRCHGISRTDSS